MSPGGAVTSTGRSKVPIRVGETRSELSTGGGGLTGDGFVETPKVPFMPRRACPEIEHRNVNAPFFGNVAVMT